MIFGALTNGKWSRWVPHVLIAVLVVLLLLQSQSPGSLLRKGNDFSQQATFEVHEAPAQDFSAENATLGVS
jgi:hypothetical protein